MPPQVLRLGGVARLDPSPEHELGVWRADLERGALDDPDEIARRLAEHERGDVVIVELGVFAELADGDRLRRVDGIHVPGLWFRRGDPEQNARHAAEIVSDRIEAIRDDLHQHGIESSADELAQLPILVEVGDDVEQALASGAG